MSVCGSVKCEQSLQQRDARCEPWLVGGLSGIFALVGRLYVAGGSAERVLSVKVTVPRWANAKKEGRKEGRKNGKQACSIWQAFHCILSSCFWQFWQFAIERLLWITYKFIELRSFSKNSTRISCVISHKFEEKYLSVCKELRTHFVWIILFLHLCLHLYYVIVAGSQLVCVKRNDTLRYRRRRMDSYVMWKACELNLQASRLVLFVLVKHVLMVFQCVCTETVVFFICVML